MLRALSIRDYVIVERLDLELGAGFTALTGETGAGKSILVEAVALVLGGRADAGVVRAGAERAEIAAEFEIAGARAARDWLAGNDLEDGEASCLLRRTVDASGRSRAFVNGRPATVAQLRALGETLLDIHGQHDHRLLTSREHQRGLLDAFGGFEELARATAERFGQWRRLCAQRAAREGAQASSAREREFLAHEIREIEALAFEPARFADEEAEHRRLAHGQELAEAAGECAQALDDSEGSVAERLAQAATRLAQAAALDPGLEEARSEAEGALVQAREAALSLRRYLQGLEPDPGRLAELDRRLKAVHELARKLRIEPGALPEALGERRERLSELGGEESLEVLRAQESAAGEAYLQAARELSEARRGAARRLGAEVTRTMQTLAMTGGRLVVGLEPLAEPSAGGLEAVELQVAAHAGQPLAPLARAASGGELSRIALAIQVLLSGQASVPTLIFDEVDAGIGGGVAEVVGRLLHSLADRHQVLCVTHLAQVATHAGEQLRVTKHPDARGTRAGVERLGPEERVAEVARMIGGLRITQATRRHAEEMLQNARAASTSARKAKGRAAAGPS